MSPYTEEQKAQARAEWVLGLKNPAQIARELGIKGRTTIYSWASEGSWPPRGSAQAAIREQIDSEVIRQAADDLRSRARSSETPDDERLAQMMADLALDADETAPEGQQIVREYALAVTEVLRKHQQQAAEACDIGDNLLAMYHACVTTLRGHFERMPGSKREGTMKRMEMVAKTAGQYATLVRALQIAQRMQRDAMAIEGRGEGDKVPAPGDTPPAGAAPQPGSYEEVLLEADRRGELQ